MRILLWHGWLLEGSGSNIATARVAGAYRAARHDVLLLCQETHAERYAWIDGSGTVGPDGPYELLEGARAPGRCILLRPAIGDLLPVFVYDEYEGFEVKRFVDLTDDELKAYLDRNVDALRAAVAWHGSDVVIAGHAVPGAVIAKRALGAGRYVAKIHGSDIEYAVRAQARYLDLAREGLEAARSVVGPSSDVLERCVELIRGARRLARRVPPGVEARTFRPRPRREALLAVAEALRLDPDAARGRPSSTGAQVKAALARRDAGALSELATTYDQDVPDADAADKLRALAGNDGAIVGSFGKLIPQKGVQLLLAATRATVHRPHVLVVGFGSYREWLEALALALRTGDAGALEWLETAGDLERVAGEGAGSGAAFTFTGRLDHRYAPGVLAAMDVLVVPSILAEAFGIVTVEGAAAGALPLVARHSGLAEVAAALEAAVGRPGLFSFEPGGGAARNLAGGIDRILALPAEERAELGRDVSAFAASEWSWTRTAERLLEIAR